ncbi:MAG: glycosyltransferase family 4 protein [Candidatus Dormibacteria bacterium]
MAIGIDASRAFQAAPTGIGVYSTQVISRLIPDPPAPLWLYLNSRRPPEAAPPLAAGSEFRCLRLPRGWTAVRLRLELQRRPPSLLWVPAYRLPGGALPRAVVTVHGVEHRFAASTYTAGERRAMERFVADTLRRAARVIAPSETTKADLVHLYGAAPDQVVVIPHGVAPEFVPLSEEVSLPVLEELGVTRPYFLVVGAHHPRKQVPFLLDQFAQAFPSPSHSGPQLVVTNAEAETAQALQAQAARLGLPRRLRTLPHLGGSRLAALYSAAVAACVPSLYEGFGLPALEAMACGTAVIANQAGGVQELARGAAELIAPGDAHGWAQGLRRLLDDPAQRAHLSKLGRARAQDFSWERSASAHRELLAAELALAQESAAPG